MENVKFSKWLSGLVDYIDDVKLKDSQRIVVKDTMSEWLSDDINKEIVCNDAPLTLEKVKASGVDYHDYGGAVYTFKTKYGWTLVQDGEILCKDVMFCNWYKNDVYWFETKNGWTLFQGDKVLCKDVKWCGWYEEDIYRYENKNGLTLMHGDTALCKDVDWCHWLGDGKYWYKTHEGDRFIETI